jgi:hypothetical protein
MASSLLVLMLSSLYVAFAFFGDASSGSALCFGRLRSAGCVNVFVDRSMPLPGEMP